MVRKDGDRWARLLTESRNPRSARLDTMPVAAVVRLLLDEDRQAISAALREERAITRAAGEVVRALGGGGRVLFLGAGTSGRLGVIEAAECPPTFSTPSARVQALIAGGRRAVFRSIEGAEDDAAAARRAIARAIRAGDAVVGIAASGITAYVG